MVNSRNRFWNGRRYSGRFIRYLRLSGYGKSPIAFTRVDERQDEVIVVTDPAALTFICNDKYTFGRAPMDLDFIRNVLGEGLIWVESLYPHHVLSSTDSKCSDSHYRGRSYTPESHYSTFVHHGLSERTLSTILRESACRMWFLDLSYQSSTS